PNERQASSKSEVPGPKSSSRFPRGEGDPTSDLEHGTWDSGFGISLTSCRVSLRSCVLNSARNIEEHDMKRIGRAALAVIVLASFSGCANDSGSVFYRAWKHLEWHLLGAYKDLANLHKDIDKFIFNLDERDPDRY